MGRSKNQTNPTSLLDNPLKLLTTDLVDAVAGEFCPALLTHPHRAILAVGQDGALGKGNTIYSLPRRIISDGPLRLTRPL